MKPRILFALFLTLLIGCKSREKHAPIQAKPSLPMNTEERALAICNKLVTEGVAYHCEVKQTHHVNWKMATFKPVGLFKEDQGLVMVYIDEKSFHDGEDLSAKEFAADDYPNLRAKTAANVSWGWASVSVGSEGMQTDVWDRCTAKKSAAACAKQYPKEYAAARTLYQTAQRFLVSSSSS